MRTKYVIWVKVEGSKYEDFYKSYDDKQKAQEELEGILTVKGIVNARLSILEY